MFCVREPDAVGFGVGIVTARGLVDHCDEGLNVAGCNLNLVGKVCNTDELDSIAGVVVVALVSHDVTVAVGWYP